MSCCSPDLSLESTIAPASAADVAAKADLSQAVVDIGTGTTYTIQASDNGKQLLFRGATTVTITVPDTIVPASGFAFQCQLVQEAAGQLSLTVSGTMAAILKPAAFVTKSREQESVLTLYIYSATKSRLAGDLAFV